MNALEKHVMRLIGENIDSPDVFTDDNIAPIRDSINDAIQLLCMVTGTYKKTYMLPLMAGRMFYRLSWGQDLFGWITEVWDRSRRRRLTPTSPNDLMAKDGFWLKRDGTPDYYMQMGVDILGVYYKPSANGVTLEIECVCIPKAYTTDNQQIKVREVFQNSAVYFAVSEFYASRGNAKRASSYLEMAMETADIMTMHPRAAERIYSFGGAGDIGPYPGRTRMASGRG